jgi:hypothetical protein
MEDSAAMVKNPSLPQLKPSYAPFSRTFTLMRHPLSAPPLAIARSREGREYLTRGENSREFFDTG